MDTTWILYSGIGAGGGVVTTLQWLKERHDKPVKDRKPINPYKVVRNLACGAIAGGFFGTSTKSMEIAFMTGTAGEYYIQKAGKAVELRLSK